MFYIRGWCSSYVLFLGLTLLMMFYIASDFECLTIHFNYTGDLRNFAVGNLPKAFLFVLQRAPLVRLLTLISYPNRGEGARSL